MLVIFSGISAVGEDREAARLITHRSLSKILKFLSIIFWVRAFITSKNFLYTMKIFFFVFDFFLLLILMSFSVVLWGGILLAYSSFGYGNEVTIYINLADI
jgi:hypothetical protein